MDLTDHNLQKDNESIFFESDQIELVGIQEKLAFVSVTRTNLKDTTKTFHRAVNRDEFPPRHWQRLQATGVRGTRIVRGNGYCYV